MGAADAVGVHAVQLRVRKTHAYFLEPFFGEFGHCDFGTEVNRVARAGFGAGRNQTVFNSVEAQIAFGRLIAVRVNARHVERAIRSTIAATNALVLVNDARAAVLLGNRAFGTTEHASGFGAVHALNSRSFILIKFHVVGVKSA